MRLQFLVTVEAATAEQIAEVIANRVYTEDEDSPFDYTIDCAPFGETKEREARETEIWERANEIRRDVGLSLTWREIWSLAKRDVDARHR